MGTLGFPQALYAQHLLTVPMGLLDANWIPFTPDSQPVHRCWSYARK